MYLYLLLASCVCIIVYFACYIVLHRSINEKIKLVVRYYIKFSEI